MPTVQTNGVETYYERHGEGTPIVFSHGAGLDHRMWEPQVEVFSEDYEVVTYDMRGHGETPTGDRSEYTVGLFADDLHELVTALDLDEPIICGLSMGGMIAHQYAAAYPEDLSAVILSGTRTAEPMFLSERVLGTLVFGGVLRIGDWFGPERAETALDGFNSVLELFVDDGSSDHDDELEAIGEDATDVEDYIAVMPALHDGYTPVDRSAITVPTLVIYGERETPTTEAHAGKLAAEIDDARIEKLPETGHVANWDSPDLFTDTVLEFLTETVGT